MPSVPPASQLSKRMKVLIIDDSRTMRRLLASYLAPLVSQTYEAGNGREALEVLDKDEAVDLALVDWDMPVMNGIDFVRVVRGDTRRAGIKLLMVTAHNNMESVTEAITAGADDFLMKPLTEEMVMDKLRMMGFAA
jgi:two-component system chemotaxis response regulator CheY